MKEVTGMRIHTLEELDLSRHLRQAVICPRHPWLGRARPAAWFINLSGHVLLNAIRGGLFVFTGAKRKKDEEPLVRAVRRKRAKANQ